MFSVGDVVVCVDAGPKRGDLPRPRVAIHHLIERGRIYRVSEAGLSVLGTPMVALAGVAVPNGMRGFAAYRFRKVKPASKSFTEMVRQMKPHRVGEPA